MSLVLYAVDKGQHDQNVLQSVTVSESAMPMLINTSSLVTKYYACGRSTIRYSVTVGKPPIVLL